MGKRIQIVKPKFFMGDRKLTLAVLMRLGDWMQEKNVTDIKTLKVWTKKNVAHLSINGGGNLVLGEYKGRDRKPNQIKVR